MAENINGDNLDDTGDLDLTAIYTDEDYTGDTVFQDQDEIQAILKEREQRIGELLDHMDEVGGVNRTIAMEMENLEPGIITKYRPINSYTDDYSRTNYRETRVSLEVLHVVAVAAIAVGVGVLLAAFIGWLISTFSDDAKGGGGKGKKGKKIDERMREIGEFQAENEQNLKDFIDVARSAQGNLKKMMLDGMSEEKRKEFQASGNAYDKMLEKMYKERLASKYTVLADELTNGKSGEHTKFLSELIKMMPVMAKQIREKQHELIELSRDGNKDEIKPDKYFLDFTFGGKSGDQARSLMDQKLEYYAKICHSPPDAQWYNEVKLKTGKAIGTADFMGHLIDQIDDTLIGEWEIINKEMKGSTEALKKANPEKERMAALTQAWKNLKMGYTGAYAGYRIFNHVKAAAEKFGDGTAAAYNDQLKFVYAQCGIILKNSEDEEQKSKIKAIMDIIGEKIGKAGGWLGSLLRGGKPTPEGGDSTKPAATPPAAT